MIGAVPPQAFSIADQKKWMDNTVAFGDPVYKYPFWYWPGYTKTVQATQVERVCRPLKIGVTSEDIHACAVWTNKEPADVWWEISPPYMVDVSGGQQSQDPKYQQPKTTEEIVAEEQRRRAAEQDAKNRLMGIKTTTWLIVAMLGAGAYYGYKQLNKR